MRKEKKMTLSLLIYSMEAKNFVGRFKILEQARDTTALTKKKTYY